ncbi:MAG TPA: TenA family protein [Desulfomonilia bacterium]
MTGNFRSRTVFLILLIILFHNIPSHATSLTDEMFKENEDLYQKILHMPFNSELIKGTLDENIFKNYIIQDYIYLEYYRKAFAILLSKAPDDKASAFIVSTIKAIDDEIGNVHNVYIKQFNISKTELANVSPLPSTELYVSYLIKTACLEPFETGLAAMLPCDWVYYRLGGDMSKAKPSPDNKYAKWIEGYTPVKWESSETKAFTDLLGGYMENTTDENRLKMRQAFKTSMNLEYMFWDGIYRDVKWIQ